MSLVLNEEVTLLPSSSRTTTQTSADLQNLGGKTLVVVLDMTTVGTGSVTVTINGKDTASGKYYLLLAGAAVATNSTNRYVVAPDVAAVTNVSGKDYVPTVFQIVVTANNANPAVYTLGYNLLRS